MISYLPAYYHPWLQVRNLTTRPLLGVPRYHGVEYLPLFYSVYCLTLDVLWSTVLNSFFCYLCESFHSNGPETCTMKEYATPKEPLDAFLVRACSGLLHWSADVNIQVLMCQWFAPTKLKVTFETEGKGKFNAEDVERLVVRNKSGEVAYLNLPTKFVLISNHQVRCLFLLAIVFYLMSDEGLCRLVVCLVLDLFPGATRGASVCLYYSEEKSQVDSSCRLGMRPG